MNMASAAPCALKVGDIPPTMATLACDAGMTQMTTTTVLAEEKAADGA